jgi:hypothetical protein
LALFSSLRQFAGRFLVQLQVETTGRIKGRRQEGKERPKNKWGNELVCMHNLPCKPPSQTHLEGPVKVLVHLNAL